ncbi:MAG: rhodanese-like domain-containing protein [Gammaproteobacteria bacterium]|nr:rhodanese-like domain-containing protein [Gammaproteobacteria bacterium]MCK5090934.1 rhodanese-like domain-containing protein [Gammaproteobacteria bacterium]
MKKIFPQFLWFIVCFLLVTTTQAKEKIKSPDSIPGTTKVNAERLIELVGSIPNLIVIDSRIRTDRTQGYIEGSLSLPDEETDCESLSLIIPVKNNPSLFYCNGPKCGRSVKASKIAVACGYTNIYWFRGGFAEWKDKNYPFFKE